MTLPLREYYPVSRAAELLSCTPDDFVHWAGIGAIRLYLPFENGYGYAYFHLQSQELKVNLLKTSMSNDEYSRVSTIISSENDIFSNEPPYDDGVIVAFNGFWGLSPFMYNNGYIYDYFSDNNFNWLHSFNDNIFVLFKPKDICTFELNDLHISKRDFVRIFNSSKSECNALDIIYSIRKDEGVPTNKVVKERVSSTSRDVIKVLIKKAYPELENNPVKLAGVLSKEAELMGMVNVEFDGSTISRWLNK